MSFQTTSVNHTNTSGIDTSRYFAVEEKPINVPRLGCVVVRLTKAMGVEIDDLNKRGTRDAADITGYEDGGVTLREMNVRGAVLLSVHISDESGGDRSIQSNYNAAKMTVSDTREAFNPVMVFLGGSDVGSIIAIFNEEMNIVESERGSTTFIAPLNELDAIVDRIFKKIRKSFIVGIYGMELRFINEPMLEHLSQADLDACCSIILEYQNVVYE